MRIFLQEDKNAIYTSQLASSIFTTSTKIMNEHLILFGDIQNLLKKIDFFLQKINILHLQNYFFYSGKLIIQGSVPVND